jgi:hypothetical protein
MDIEFDHEFTEEDFPSEQRREIKLGDEKGVIRNVRSNWKWIVWAYFGVYQYPLVQSYYDRGRVGSPLPGDQERL